MNTIYAYVGNGKLGSILKNRPNFAFLDCDITDPNSIEMALKLFRIKWGEPSLIVNCAGLTSIEACEANEKWAFALNVFGLYNLHEVFGARVLSISSDQVFRGKYIFKPTESTPPLPINSYGWSKFGMEQMSQSFDGKVIRLSRTVSVFDRDFIEYMSQLTHGMQISVPSFFWRNYLSRSQAVNGIEYFATHYDDMPQLVNYGGAQNVSMYKLFQELAKKMRLPVENVLPRTQDLSMKTPRPHWGGYNVNLASRLGFPMYSLKEVVDSIVKDLDKINV